MQFKILLSTSSDMKLNHLADHTTVMIYDDVQFFIIFIIHRLKATKVDRAYLGH